MLHTKTKAGYPSLSHQFNWLLTSYELYTAWGWPSHMRACPKVDYSWKTRPIMLDIAPATQQITKTNDADNKPIVSEDLKPVCQSRHTMSKNHQCMCCEKWQGLFSAWQEQHGQSHYLAWWHVGTKISTSHLQHLTSSLWLTLLHNFFFTNPREVNTPYFNTLQWTYHSLDTLSFTRYDFAWQNSKLGKEISLVHVILQKQTRMGLALFSDPCIIYLLIHVHKNLYLILWFC